MSHSKFFVSALGAFTLLASVACSGTRGGAGELPGALDVAADTSSADSASPAGTLSAELAPPAGTPPQAADRGAALRVIDASGVDPSTPVRSARPSSIQLLNQMLTTQALLVSLLLTPLSKDTSEQPLARVDTPPSAARLR